MSADERPADATGPDLRKAEPPAYEPPEQPGSIWQPLDGSAPQQPRPVVQPPSPLDATQQVWGRAFQGGTPAPPQVAAAYSAAAGTAPSGVFTLASWGRRLGAFIIDALLFGVVGLVLLIPVGLWAGLTVEETIRFFGMVDTAPNVANTTPLYAALVVQRLVIGAVPAFFLARWNGQTPGKRALGLRVMRADGGAMDLRTALRRELLGRTLVVDGLTLITFGLAGLVNYLMPLWDVQRRTGHDRIADTRVVLAPAEPQR